VIEALNIQVKGIVQGVGFRPFVYRLAKKYLINGWVLNATEGVTIHAEGESKLLDEFVNELHMNPPAAAKVKELDLDEVPLEDCETFEIRTSDDAAANQTTLVSPDLATCDDCLTELFNPNDRRYRYPFINCTNCGPRFTIIDSLPYDRPATSMGGFKMCPQCAGEYADPLNRRFHAQPDACWECGPQVSWSVPKGLAAGEAAGGEGEAFNAAGMAVEAASAGVSTDATEGVADGVSTDSDNWEIIWGISREASDSIFASAVQLLLDGGILAVKGLGGFHLVCDASNPDALAKLRQRKRRQGRAFAVMVGSADDARRVCRVDAVEQEQLESTKRPIVLLRKRPEAQLAAGLADKLPELGVMLPCTPVQHLLLHDFAAALREARGEDALPMLVMTSGNLHNEPIITDDAEAREKLAGVADAILGNNREILSRYDDSVLRVVQAGGEQAIQFIRRARGFAPLPLALGCPEVSPAQETLLATGSEQKATFTLVRGAGEAGAAGEGTAASADGSTAGAAEGSAGEGGSMADSAASSSDSSTATAATDSVPDAFVSQHIGDVENAETYDAWMEAKQRYEKLFQVKPTRIACDLHPEYLTSKWAREQAEQIGAKLTQVQHHHAHIASVLGENNLFGPVCGIAFDGTGYGVDGRIWGGEVMIANQQAFERFANFAYVPMPGGAAAVKDPRRMAYGVLYAFDLLEHPGTKTLLESMGDAAELCDQMIDRGLNTPYTSSVGRLFDAASAILGVCPQPTYEGQPAIELEAAIGLPAAEPAPGIPAADAYRINVVKNTATKDSTAQDTSVVVFDAAPAFESLLDDVAAGTPTATIARRFHDGFVNAVLMSAQLANSVYGITTIALSGGVFMNRYLIEHATALLQNAGFTVALNQDLPPNDGCVSYGQAVVAWAQDKTSNGESEGEGEVAAGETAADGE
jgi:hydrogenase maturation protein HypF